MLNQLNLYTLSARVHPRLGGLVLGVLCVVIAFSGGVQAETPSNANSALGMNLQAVSYFSSELPFLNVFKLAGSWITHGNQYDTGETKYLNLDADGWPKSLTAINNPSPQQFTSVGVLLLRNLPQTANGYYPAGRYVVLYDGQGTLSYGFDATLVSSSPGRDVINVAKPTYDGGIDLRITATDPNHNGNYVKNIRVVKAENESLLKSGQLFSPTFLGLLKNFRALRFMDWLGANSTTVSSWSDRPLLSNAFWGTANGVPLEVAIQLANAVSADAWVNAPVKADNNYLTQMATLVYNQLGTSQKAYVELSNEVWNGGFPQNAYSISQGTAQFPKAQNQWYAGDEWYGMRVAQMADIWYGVYGSSAFNSRVVVVMAGQAANADVLAQELATSDWTGPGNGPAANHHIGAAAIAPYFFSTPSAADFAVMMAAADGGLSSLLSTVTSKGSFASIPSGGQIALSNAWTTSNAKVASSYKIPLVAYEGGQSLQAVPTFAPGSPQLTLMINANRDPRMGAAYTQYLNGWKANGGTLFMHFNDSFPPTVFGEWGALESVMQTTSPLSSAPPKWQAIQNFITNNPCWWPSCAGTVSSGGPTPSAPSNFKVQ
jgi:hypothetical protein